MSNWLDRARPPKYLRCFFYIVYSFYRSYKSERKEAPVTAILFLAFCHMFFFLGVFIFLYSFYINTLNLNDIQTEYKLDSYLKLTFLCGFTLNCIFFYYGFYSNRKWESYIIEFSHLKKKDRRKKAIHLFIYLLIMMLFFISSGWMIMQTSPYYK
ncbi:hypothetical protein [Aquimarina longa]|uniref:hypothetical protein n=1 Tax=Aquimarina longa TaxID=1080221 RepID=UPI00078558E9|nr:hypothetical protein [Aquimarina longa]